MLQGKGNNFVVYLNRGGDKSDFFRWNSSPSNVVVLAERENLSVSKFKGIKSDIFVTRQSIFGGEWAFKC